MAGIYLHIPFCKKACHYCDFHFSTSLKQKKAMVDALVLELEQRKGEVDEAIETIYLGGGTPSILSIDEIELLLDTIFKNYRLIENPEITLEANPDDLTEAKILSLSKTQINRLSIGVQSFHDRELQMMNRAHSADEVKKCLTIATQYFPNITIDLMYGIPGMTDEVWVQNIHRAMSFGIPHISSYALTVEENTALDAFIKKGKYPALDEALAERHFNILVDTLKKEGYQHYEVSNFAKSNYKSKHNSSYWLGKKYLGIGPSAHSYNGKERGWNINHNKKYIEGIVSGHRNHEVEVLTEQDRFNEVMMIGLRTDYGISLEKISSEFGLEVLQNFKNRIQPFIDNQTVVLEQNIFKTTSKGRFLADGIAADLFWV